MHDLTLAFDLDGTLVDTAPDLLHATNHVLAGGGFAPAPPALIRGVISSGARAMIETALAAQEVDLPAAAVDRLLRRFLDYYADNIAISSRPYAGLAEVLERYRGFGTRLVVCTNKREELSRNLLTALGLEHYFSIIAGRDTFAVFKPDPGHLTQAIQLAGGRPERAIMVGDSQTDIATANAAAIPVIGVTFGYSDPPMTQLQPTVAIDSYAEFHDVVGQLLDQNIGAVTTPGADVADKPA